MDILQKALKTIELFYPYDLNFENPDYQKTSQYQNLLNKRTEFEKNIDLQSKITNLLDRLFTGYCIKDWTDLSSNNCREFRILLHKGQSILDDDVELVKSLGNKRRDVFVFISAISNFYYAIINESSYDSEKDNWSFEKIEADEETKELLNKLKDGMSVIGYEELSQAAAESIVETVETEYVEKGKVTVFNCLFTDLTGI